jgi:hypothetical protein
MHAKHTTAIASLLVVASAVISTGCSKPPPSPVGAPAAAATSERGGGATGTEATTPEAPTPDKASATPPSPADHGAPTPLGALDLGAYHFELTARGRVVPGQELAITAKVTGGVSADAWRQLQVFAAVEADDGTPVSRPGRAIVEKGELHMHTSVLPAAGVPKRLVIRLREGEVDVRGRLDLPAAIVQEIASSHEGRVARLEDPAGLHLGYVEVKLHDDKGDLELWLVGTKGGPLDVPLSTKLTLTFSAPQAKVITASPRDQTTNPDEDGKPNARTGATNYFIFPGDTGADATWLKGSDFKGLLTVSVPRDGVSLASPTFELRAHGLPGHAHSPGGHGH